MWFRMEDGIISDVDQEVNLPSDGEEWWVEVWISADEWVRISTDKFAKNSKASVADSWNLASKNN